MAQLYLKSVLTHTIPNALSISNGVTIGRASSNNLCVKDKTVSRVHCTFLDKGSDDFWVCNLSDTNTLKVNESEVEESPIKLGDKITCGLVEFNVVLENEQEDELVPGFFEELTFQKTIPIQIECFGEKAIEFGAIITKVFNFSASIAQCETSDNLLHETQDLLKELFSPSYIYIKTLYGESVFETTENTLETHEIFNLEQLAKAQTNCFGWTSDSLHNIVTPLISECDIFIYLQSDINASMESQQAIDLMGAISRILNLKLESISQIRFLKHENEQLLKKIEENIELIGQSESVLSLKSYIHKISPTDLNIFVDGENGTGKELVTQIIHHLSKRASGPLVIRNCAAIAGELFESEFFGHLKGSFSGAIANKDGFMKAADTGTLVLDEITELSLGHQATLLRAIEYGTFSKVGSLEELTVDVRIIAVTNKNIKDLIKQGKFREDLYHRIAQINIEVPPLREHVEDMELLVQHFVDKGNKLTHHPINGLTDEAYSLLKAYSWPGNVRELQNIIFRALALTENFSIGAEDLEIPKGNKELSNTSMNIPLTTLSELERIQITNALKYTNGDIESTAKILGIGKSTLYKKIKKG